MDTERAPLVKFIKKIPPSGGSPAYKLTLPHQVVHAQLLHLVDEVFELAPCLEAQQSWQGSIAPRRNKERSEYTLQGWKLFAEAHKIQAGDQVSFELVAPRRMVVQVIRAADSSMPRKPFKLPQKSRPSKILKFQGNGSPGSSQHFLCENEEVPQYWIESSLYDLNSAEGMDDWTVFTDPQLTPSDEGSSDQDGLCHTAPLSVEPRKGLKSSQSWMADTGFKQSSPARPAQRQFGKSLSDSSYSSIALSAMAHRPESSTDLLGKSSSMPALLQEDPDADLDYGSQLFTEMLTAPPSDTLKGIPASPDVPDSVFQGLFNQAGTGMIPTAATGSPPPSDIKPDATPELDTQLGNLSATIQKLHKDAKRFQAEAFRAQQEAAHVNETLQQQQSQLDRQAREALRAAMGLEHCATNLAHAAKQGCEGHLPPAMSLSIQGDMVKCLGILKESLWQLLVLATNEEDLAT